MLRKLMAGAIAAAIFSSVAMAGPVNTIDVFLSVRDNGSTAGIGNAGPQAGELEFIGRGAHPLTLDGTWQEIVFDINNEAITAFTGNGVLDMATGIIDALVFEAPSATPLTVWMDDMTTTVDPPSVPPPVTTVIHDWEGFTDGDEVGFQEPTFSGSTDDNLAAGFGTSEVDSTEQNSGLASYKTLMDIIDNQDSGGLFGYGVRLTTFNAPILQAPTISFGANGEESTVSIFLKGLPVPEPASLALLAFGGLTLVRRRR